MRLALLAIIIIAGGLGVYAQAISDQLNRPAEFQRQILSAVARQHAVTSPKPAM